MATYEELKAKLVIDKNKLDEELQANPQLIADIAEAYAEALDKRDSSSEILKGVDADVSLDLRKNATEKLTEDKVKAMILVDPRHREQANKVLNYGKEFSLIQGLLKAADARTKALSGLVELHKTGYYGSGVDSKYLSALNAEAEARRNRKQVQADGAV